jgi:hypothetical protein
MNIPERILTVVLCVLIILGVSRFQAWYFNKPDIVARRAARASLPPWLQSFGQLLMLGWLGAMLAACFEAARFANQIIHPGVPYLSSGTITASWASFFDMLKLLPIFFIALPLGLLLANATLWAIPSIRRIDSQAAEGVPGASFKEASIGLIYLATILVPLSAYPLDFA